MGGDTRIQCGANRRRGRGGRGEIITKKRPLCMGTPFVLMLYPQLLWCFVAQELMLRIIFFAADFPEVRLHGFLAAGGVFLGEEGCQVGRDLGQVFLAGFDHTGDGLEALASVQFVGGGLGGTLHLRTEVQAVAVLVFGRRYAVGCQQHFGARMMTVLARFCQGTRYMIDAG